MFELDLEGYFKRRKNGKEHMKPRKQCAEISKRACPVTKITSSS